MRLLPTTLIASVVAFACTGGLALIATQRERDPDPAGPLEAA
jgi:hypothetical protein